MSKVIAEIVQISNGYLLVSKTDANGKKETVYFSDPTKSSEAVANMLAKQKLTQDKPFQYVLFSENEGDLNV